MALNILTFTAAAVPFPSKIFNHSIQPKIPLQLHFSIPISTRHLSVPQSSTQPQKYVYPDPIPEFAVAKFKTELLKKLSKEKETFGDELDDVVSVCAERWIIYFKGTDIRAYSMEKNNFISFGSHIRR
ncbi:uncharacterized protein [Nicotiana sylvestris]|uniref:uncharacterized protein isoform X2 n=1 Tax=Nicotiana sylvestris TaxID=4096 RepID=UPI00388CCF74